MRRGFRPGALTLVLPKAASVLNVVTGGQDTVAIRVPAHPMAQQLLTAFGGGLAAPSANRYGHVSPTRADHVRDELGDAVRVVLDGGECTVGIESTIVACTPAGIRLLRPGSITLSELRSVVGEISAEQAADEPRVPGSTVSHYAPTTALEIVTGDALETLAGQYNDRGERVAVLALRLPLKTLKLATWINAGRRPQQYAHDLYAHLRTLDKAGCVRILVQELPEDERWDAVNDRLRKAAAKAAVPNQSRTRPARRARAVRSGHWVGGLCQLRADHIRCGCHPKMHARKHCTPELAQSPRANGRILLPGLVSRDGSLRCPLAQLGDSLGHHARQRPCRLELPEYVRRRRSLLRGVRGVQRGNHGLLDLRARKSVAGCREAPELCSVRRSARAYWRECDRISSRTALDGRSTKKISSKRPLRISSGGSAEMSLAVATTNTGDLAAPPAR